MVVTGPVHGCFQQGGILTMDDGRVRIGTRLIAAVEMRPWVGQAADARVLVHLSGGQTITVFYGSFHDANERAQEVADFVANVMPGQP